MIETKVEHCEPFKKGALFLVTCKTTHFDHFTVTPWLREVTIKGCPLPLGHSENASIMLQLNLAVLSLWKRGGSGLLCSAVRTGSSGPVGTLTC